MNIDINELVSLISSVGFPIVSCGAMFWMLYKSQLLNKEQVDKLAEAVDNNTSVIRELINKLSVR